MLARVMVDVRRPQDAHLVVDAVEPVVAVVLGEQEHEPRPPPAVAEVDERGAS